MKSNQYFVKSLSNFTHTHTHKYISKCSKSAKRIQHDSTVMAQGTNINGIFWSDVISDVVTNEVVILFSSNIRDDSFQNYRYF